VPKFVVFFGRFLRFESGFLASLASHTACRRIFAKLRIRVKLYAAIVSTNVRAPSLAASAPPT